MASDNGYTGRDWTGVGISRASTSSSSTRADTSGSATVSAPRPLRHVDSGRLVYVPGGPLRRIHYGRDDGIKYVNGYKSKVVNRTPIIPSRGLNAGPNRRPVLQRRLMINSCGAL